MVAARAKSMAGILNLKRSLQSRAASRLIIRWAPRFFRILARLAGFYESGRSRNALTDFQG
jgi:hypothetical protein